MFILGGRRGWSLKCWELVQIPFLSPFPLVPPEVGGRQMWTAYSWTCTGLLASKTNSQKKLLETKSREKGPQHSNYFSWIFLPAETNADPLKNTGFPFSPSGSRETVISGNSSTRTMLFNYAIIRLWQALLASSIHSTLFTPCFVFIVSMLLWFRCYCCASSY